MKHLLFPQFSFKQKQGFTLIELLAVIAIIGILATFAAISISGAVKRARDSVRERDLTNVKQALELYNQDNGSYPVSGNSGSESALIVPNDPRNVLSPLVNNGYMRILPTDSKASAGHTGYLYTSDGTNYVLWAQLEYSKTQQTLSSFSSCADAQTGLSVHGNGVVQDKNMACFRLTND